MEFLYTVAPFLIIAVLFYYTAIVQTDVDKLSRQPGRHRRGRRVQVELAVQLPRARQGRRTASTVASTLGTSDVIPVLVLPTSKQIRFEETSRDVIHSFWVPELLFKRDVFPGNVRNAVRGHHRPGGRATSAAAPSCAAPTTR